MERRQQPVVSAFINSNACASTELHQQPIGNSCLSESPSENMRKAFLPAMRISTSRSRSHSLISSMSTSPTNTSENGEIKKEKDKSYRRKSHLNRAFTEEPVPDIDYSIDLDSEGRKRNRILTQDAYMPEGKSPSVSDSSKLQKCIQKAPNIPSIFNKSEKQSQELSPFTANTVSASPSKNPSPKLKQESQSPKLKQESQSPKLKQESQSPKLKQESPSPKPKNKSSGISNKAQSFETKGSPVMKRDSFSDAEGVSFIKKLLQKESMEKATDEKPGVSQNLKVPDGNKNKESSFCLKKSPSAGSNSYWSRFSNSQPAFLKRFFEKSEKSPILNDNSTVLTNANASKLPEPRTARSLSVQPKEPEKGMGFSVAQKASFFMKLEHEQRFSKWRKNSVAEVEVSSVQDTNATRTKVRHLTQPVTPTEVEFASQYFTENNNGEANKIVKSVDELFGNAISDISFNAQENEEMAPLGTQQGISSSYNDCDDLSFPSELQSDLDPSNLSLKDRVHMFDKIITTSTKAPISSAPTPRPPSKMYGSCAPKTNGSLQMLPPSGQSYMSGGTTYCSTTTTCTTHFMHHPSMDPFGDEMYDQGNSFPVIRRRGSTSDVELSSTPKYSPLTPRSFKVKSMCMSGHGNNDSENFSEDGEVSSGGQEVAEIISKSYENSPIFRKKIWRNQQKQTQATFSKEIWRRCVAQENWSAPQMSYERPPQNYKATSKITETPRTTTPPLPPPPATSNLLPILTALSSSNDELNDPKPISRKIQQQSTFSSTSSSTTDIRNKMEVYVKVPHPDDESFQNFYKNNSSSGFASGNFGAVSFDQNQIQFSNNNFQTENGATADGGMANIEGLNRNGSEVSLEEICSVKRQSDLLVMKKNMPVVRRKSSGKTRNPLKALAARMDFRNQKYTEAHIVDDNSVPNEDQQL